MTTERWRKARGRVLELLGKMGGTATVRAIERTFLRAGMEPEAEYLSDLIAYLADPETRYVRHELRKDEFSGVEQWIVELTARGRNLLDRTVVDPGVEIAE